jgi:hypothetical protein
MFRSTRLVIPVGYHVFQLSLIGERPLLMSSGEADPDGETFKAFRSLSKIRNKSDGEEARFRELEWYTRLYYDEQVGVYIPGKNIKELLRSAATKWCQGEDFRRALIVPEYRIPLMYDGPEAPADLWAAGFRFTARVAVGTGRVIRTRPCFDEWALRCDIAYDPKRLNFGLIEDVVARSTEYGLGDYRPNFGAFRANVVV